MFSLLGSMSQMGSVPRGFYLDAQTDKSFYMLVVSPVDARRQNALDACLARSVRDRVSRHLHHWNKLGPSRVLTSPIAVKTWNVCTMKESLSQDCGLAP